jgi:hypothetical protein
MSVTNPTLAGLIGETPRKRSASSAGQGETDRKRLAEDFKQLIGRAIERGIVLAGMTKQEVSYAMGYPDASALSRWIAGTETPQFARLFIVEALQAPLCVALSEIAKDAVVTTHISIRRAG